MMTLGYVLNVGYLSLSKSIHFQSKSSVNSHPNPRIHSQITANLNNTSNLINRRHFIVSILPSLLTVPSISLASESDQTNPNCLAKGVIKGRLAGCPSDSKCVSTSAIGSPDKVISPFTFNESSLEASKKFIEYINSRSDMQMITSKYPYFHVEYSADAIRGKSDLEFLFREHSNVVGIRAINQKSNQVYAFSGPSINLKGLLYDIRTQLQWNVQDNEILLR